MPVELRKRVAKAPPPAPEPPKKKAAKAKPAPKAKEAEKPAAAAAAEEAPAAAAPAAPAKTNGAAAKKPAVGDTIDPATFASGATITLNDGTTTTFAALVADSTAGLVLFTYPKASTPGCTTQVCLFRDAYAALNSDAGLAIFGLSRDSPKANTTFKDKQKLPYPLLCDPKGELIGAIGLAKPGGTTRGVFVVDKKGKVLVAEAGGPAATLKAVEAVVEELGGEGAKEEVEKEVKEGEEKEEKEEEKEKVNGDGPSEEDKEVEKAEAEGI